MKKNEVNLTQTTALSSELRVIFSVLEELCVVKGRGFCEYVGYSNDKQVVEHVIIPRLGYTAEIAEARFNVIKHRLGQVRLDEYGKLIAHDGGANKKPVEDDDDRIARIERKLNAVMIDLGLDPATYAKG